MQESLHITVTATALLDALRDGGSDEAWRELDARYRPVLFRLGLRLGLDDADAADAAQEALLEFFRDYRAGRYERGRGRLRGWLCSIGRHRVLDALRRRRRQAPVGGDTLIDGLEPSQGQELERVWEAELEAEILRRAFEALRAHSETDAASLEVFREHALEGRPAAEVARAHGVTLSTVYSVKSRCLKRLSDLREEVRALYEDLG